MRAMLFTLLCLSLSLSAAPLPAAEPSAKKVPVVFAAYAESAGVAV